MKCTFDFNKRAYVVPPLLCGKIDVELEILYVRLSVEVVKVMEAFVCFAHKFDEVHAHNMLALMLDS